MSFGMSNVGVTRRPRRRASASRPGSSSPSAGALRTARSGFGRSVEEVARARSGRRASGRRRRPAGRRTRPGRPPAARRGRRGAATSARRRRAARRTRPCRDGRRPRSRGRPRSAGRRRARSGRSARRGRGPAGPSAHGAPAHAPPASASSAGQCRTSRSVPSAAATWLTMDGIGAAYATDDAAMGRGRYHRRDGCRRRLGRDRRSGLRPPLRVLRPEHRGRSSATARRSSSTPARRTTRPARSSPTCAS